jgi:hypothetical protein
MSVCKRLKSCFGGVEEWVRRPVPGSASGTQLPSSERLCGTARQCGKYRDGLTQELGVEVVDENLLYARFGETVLAIHCDKLAAYALQLRESHGCGG